MKARTAAGRILVWAGAWLPFFLLFLLFGRIYGGSMRAATRGASLAIGSAALLSLPVRRMCRSLPWPSRLDHAFVLRQALAALTFGLAWTAIRYGYEAAVSRRSMLSLIVSSPASGWEFLMGLWLYGWIAGLTYAVDLRRSAEEQESRASAAEAQAAAARLEAIRARLHPHFLFNALHSLGVLVRSDPPAAEAAVESLGELLRLALRRDARSLVPLDEEWSFSRRYLEFERIRYGDRLRVASALGEDALDCLVPPFALQTLVENAVQHAVSLAEGGRIEVRANLASGKLTLEVADDGAPAGLGGPWEGHQYGLTALRERMSNLYGPGADLETRQTDGGGFLVRLVAPALRSDDLEAGERPGGAPA